MFLQAFKRQTGQWQFSERNDLGLSRARCHQCQQPGLPAHCWRIRRRHPTRGPLYELKPCVTAGDICGAAPYTGRGGWSCYPGSAAWLQHACFDPLLGLARCQAELTLSPGVPAGWPSFDTTLKLGGREVTLRWQRGEASTLKPHRVVQAGETVRLAELPAQASVLVCTAIE